MDKPLIIGILNVTPDSFSDGGQFLSVDAAAAHAITMLHEGADIIDVGGESTRPGASAVADDTELSRVIPVIERVARERPDAVISVDTVKSTVARDAVAAGAHIVNDVSGLRLDPRIARVCADTDAGLILMHSRGDVTDMAGFAHATYGDVAADVVHELEASVETAERSGVRRDAIAIDPGIGFSKRTSDSIQVLRSIPALVALGRPVVVGASRKRFIGELTGTGDPAGRLNGTLGANVGALALGARIFRVHDVRAHREALDVAWALLRVG